VDPEVFDVHVGPHLGAPLREVPRGLEHPLWSDVSVFDDVNRWHVAILVRKPRGRS
jgi:hypothetical protein